MAESWPAGLLHGHDVIVIEAVDIFLEEPGLSVVLRPVEVEQVVEVSVVVVAVLPPEVLVAKLLVEAVVVPGALDLQDHDDKRIEHQNGSK